MGEVRPAGCGSSPTFPSHKCDGRTPARGSDDPSVCFFKIKKRWVKRLASGAAAAARLHGGGVTKGSALIVNWSEESKTWPANRGHCSHAQIRCTDPRAPLGVSGKGVIFTPQPSLENIRRGHPGPRFIFKQSFSLGG